MTTQIVSAAMAAVHSGCDLDQLVAKLPWSKRQVDDWAGAVQSTPMRRRLFSMLSAVSLVACAGIVLIWFMQPRIALSFHERPPAAGSMIPVSSYVSVLESRFIIASNAGSASESHLEIPIILLVGVTALMPAIWLVRFRSDRRASRRTNACAICGYDLRATPESVGRASLHPMNRRVFSALAALCLLIFITTGFVFLLGLLTHYEYQVWRDYFAILDGGVFLFRKQQGGGEIIYINPLFMALAVAASGAVLAAWFFDWRRRSRQARKRGFPVKFSS